MDDKVNMLDIPGIDVVEDSEHNLIIKFKEKVIYESGDTLTIWSSEIYQKGLKDA